MQLRAVFATLAVIFAASIFQARSAQTDSITTSQSAAKPQLLKKDEGERRIRRDPPSGHFIVKVSPKSNGSQHLVMATEDVAPGDQFPMHKHFGQDEILYTGQCKKRENRNRQRGGRIFGGRSQAAAIGERVDCSGATES